jgi:LysM repeat protein
MIGRWLLLSFLALPLYLKGAPAESAAVQELRLSLDRLSYQINSQTVDLNLFQDRAQQLENSLNALKQEMRVSSSDKLLEKKVSSLDKAQEALTSDLKLLKGHLNETNLSISQLQTQLNKIDKQLTSDIQSLKNSIHSMLTLLQGDSKIYYVKSGDSLGKIAQNHRTDIKTLKKLNNLASDVIFTGQKLILP